MMYAGLKLLVGPAKHIRSKGRDQTEVEPTSLFRGLRWNPHHWTRPAKYWYPVQGTHHITQKSSRKTKTDQSKEDIINIYHLNLHENIMGEIY
jgi:hypothetical protein